MTDVEADRRSSDAFDRLCPFVGLLPYSVDDEEWFFGREIDAQLIAENLRAYELTVLYGPSGVGKSSVISAGVLPELHRHAEHERLLGRPPSVTVIHRAWQIDPIAALSESIVQAIRTQTTALPAPMRGDLRLVERLRRWSEEIGAKFFVVFDQFEEYLLYHPDPLDPVTIELAEAIAEVDDNTNVLISIREDALARLDRFDGLVPGLFDNTYRVDPLDRAAAQRVVAGSVGHYNELHPDDGVTVEPELVDEVLDRVQVRARSHTDGMVGGSRSDAVETAELQLVFERLWRHAVNVGDRSITLGTLAALGGAEDVIRSHLLDALDLLDVAEQAIAAQAFSQLVTPSGAKIAHSVSDLAAYAGVSVPAMLDVLDRLAASDLRVLRPVAAEDDDSTPRFEIFHDVLGPPIASWTAERRTALALEGERAEAKRARRRRALTIGIPIVLVALVALAGFLLYKSVEQGQRDESKSLAVDATEQLQLDPAVATATALEAYRASPTAEAVRVLRQALPELDARAVYAGHTAALTDGAPSPDGSRLITASVDGTARIWDTATGQELAVLEGHIGPVLQAAFTADESRAVTLGEDGSIRLWDVATGSQTEQLMSGLDAVYSFAIDGGARTIAVFGEPGRVELWDLETSALSGELDHGEASAVTAATFGPNDDREILVTGDTDGVVRVWDPPAGIELARWDDLYYVHDVDLVGEGDLVIIGTTDIYALVWDWVGMGSGSGLDDLVSLVHEHDAPYGVQVLRASPDDQHFVTAGDRSIALWSVSDVRASFDGAAPRFVFDPIVLRGHVGLVTDTSWSSDGDLLATADSDGRIRLWDGPTGAILDDLVGHRGTVSDVEFAPGGTLLSVSEDRTARQWSAPDDLVVRDHTGWVNDVALHEASELLVSADADGSVVGHDATSGALRWSMKSGFDGEGLGFLTSIAVSPDGRRVAAGGAFGVVNVWDVTESALVPAARWEAAAEISDLAFDPTGERLAIGTWAGAHLWAWRDRDGPIVSLLGNRGFAVVAFDPQGRRLATAGDDDRIRIWDVSTGRLVDELAGHEFGTYSITFTDDGSHLVSGGPDGTVRVLDAASGEVAILGGHTYPVTAVAAAPSGGRIVSGDSGGFVAIWDERGELLTRLRKHELYVNRVVLSDSLRLDGTSDGELTIFSAGDDKVVRGYVCSTCGSTQDLVATAERRIRSLPEAALPEAVPTLGGDIPPGTCADEPSTEEFARIDPISCEGPHELEFFASFALPDPPASPYPGPERAQALCEERASTLLESLPDGVAVVSYSSTEEAWAEGQRAVQCALVTEGDASFESPLLPSLTGGEP